MSHYYKSTPSGVKLLEKVTTPAQARKHGSAYPSVTTLLKYLPNDYINEIWKPQKLVEFAREFPDLDVEAIRDKLWGERECPETGETISSSDFGTRAHARLEAHILAWIDGGAIERHHPYDGVISPTLNYLELNGFTPLAAERMLLCEKLKTAGMLDYVGLKDGKVVLLDWKFRDCADGNGKFYENKDLPQLAIEAQMIMEQDELDYMPEIYSVCIDANTGTPHVKQWSHKMRTKGLQYFMAARNFYYDCPGLGYEA